jgi:hypothetical protein
MNLCALLTLLALAPLASAQVSVEATPVPATPKVVLTAEMLAQVKPLEAVLDRALAAYNAGDAKAFWSDAATTATPPATEKTFKALYEGYYKADFGKYVSKTIVPTETQPDPNLGVLVYEAKFEKRKVRVSANFIRESGTPKLVQVRFEKL